MVSDATVFLVVIGMGVAIGAAGVWAAITGQKENEQRRAARAIKR